MKFADGPIITCSTGIDSPSAIAVLRLTGFDDLSQFQPLLSLKLGDIKPRFAHFCQIIHEDHILDDIILLFFPAPHSFTGENLLELHVHGNPLHVSKLIGLFSKFFNLREAFPGEFTFRAYRNQKLSLTQVEGLDMLLHAKTPLALDQGVQLLSGELHQKYHRLYELIIELKSSIELLIDFSEDVGENFVRERYKKSLNEFFALFSTLKSRVGDFGDSLLNPQVVLTGPTNAGKSTLFNLLLGHKRSIVSNIAGTTRDFISEGFVYQDVYFRFVDTAGIRETVDIIEQEGISLSRQLASSAFFQIGVFDARSFSPSDQFFLEQVHKFDLIVLTHSDLLPTNHQTSTLQVPCVYSDLTRNSVTFFAPIGPAENAAPIGPAENIAPIGPVQTNAPIGAEKLIKSLIFNKYTALSGAQPLLLKRHNNCLSRLSETIDFIGDDLYLLEDLAISSSHTQRISACLTDLVGIVAPDELLDNIFDQFCIGK
jgi:tRNA modification GTPase